AAATVATSTICNALINGFAVRCANALQSVPPNLCEWDVDVAYAAAEPDDDEDSDGKKKKKRKKKDD
ncbi:MAG: hypothetical protein CFE29_10280, partial [Bradyrhizobiaceae bacterium PARB1]